MSLFPQLTEQPVIPQHIQILNVMRQQNARSLQTRKIVFSMNFQNFWRTKEIAQSICEELGTEASEWFIKSYQEQLAIKDLDHTWEMLIPPYECTLNEDGTVTIK